MNNRFKKLTQPFKNYL